jgi:hypothetical protein
MLALPKFRRRAVSETASEIADGLRSVAAAFDRLAGVCAYLAASEHSNTPGRQRELAGVIYHTAAQRFGGVKYDGQRIDQATIDQLDAMWCAMFRIDPKKLRGGR